jgi:ligand-binding sensor domain-containing protein
MAFGSFGSAEPSRWRRGWALLALLTGFTPSPGAEPITFRTFGVNAGLPNSNVNVAPRTRDGYLWVGTEGGLARFNGVRFTAFRSSNVPALTSNLIESLCETSDGALWIGTQRGLVREKAGVFEPGGLPEMSITALAADRKGRLWIGTLWQGLYCLDHGRLAAVPPSKALPSSRIRCLFVDGADRIWIGCARGNGAAYWENGALHAYNGNGEVNYEVMGICEQPLGTLWFGTQHHGVFRLRDNRLTHVSLPGRVLGLAPRDKGGVWIAAEGLWQLDAETLRFQKVPQLPTRNVQAIAEDAEGSLWLSASTDGLIQARAPSYELLPNQGLADGGGVKTVSAGGNGELWLATSLDGIMRISPNGAVMRLGARDGIVGGDEPSGVLAGREGTAWIGVSNALWKWQAGRLSKVSDFSGVHGVFEDRSGVLWVGTYQGIFRGAADGHFERLVLEGDHPGEPPIGTGFAEGGDGTMYIGSWRDGVYRLGGTQLSRMNHASGLPSDEVRAIYVDREGLLWVGMRTHGLAVLVDGKWCASEALAEVIGDHVSALMEDDDGKLWLGTTLGILATSRAELLAACRGLGPIPKIKSIGVSDGAESPSVWLGSQPTVGRTGTGDLVFATHRGALRLDPRHPGGNEVPPPVRIARWSDDERPLDPAQDAVIPAGAQRISFDFDALSLVQSDRIRFEYKLDGFSAGWTDLGSQRSVVFTRLPPRAYVFRVRAANSRRGLESAGRGAQLSGGPGPVAGGLVSAHGDRALYCRRGVPGPVCFRATIAPTRSRPRTGSGPQSRAGADCQGYSRRPGQQPDSAEASPRIGPAREGIAREGGRAGSARVDRRAQRDEVIG